jgi:hypothetical protein
MRHVRAAFNLCAWPLLTNFAAAVLPRRVTRWLRETPEDQIVA